MSADTLSADGAAVVISSPIAGYTAAGYGVVGSDQVDVLWTGGASDGQNVVLSGYGLDGAETFQNTIVQNSGNYAPGTIRNFGIVGSDSGAMVVFQAAFPSGSPQNSGSDLGVIEATIYDSGGSQLFSQTFEGGRSEYRTPYVFDSATGYHLEGEHYDSSPSGGYYERFEIGYSTTGQINESETDTLNTTTAFMPYAGTQIGGTAFTVEDNQAQLAGQAPVTLPNEPAHATTDLATAGLGGGTAAAVAWTDSGADYVSIFNADTNSFGPAVGLDWGGASDVHVVALNDGGFAVSWMNGGAHKGELFDSAGNGGGIISLAADVAGIASNGDLYTVALNASGQYVVQDYAIKGSGGAGSGQTYTSDNNGDTWVGTSGADTFHLGRGGDTVTGNGGNDTYDFAEIPWAGGHITDFNAGDALDLTGLMSTTGDSGSDGFADGYLKITDNAGGAEVWARYAASGSSSGWWLVETLNGVSASSLATSGDTVTVGSSSQGGGAPAASAVSTSDASYTAPASVNAITLTGSQQIVTANDAQNTTIWSDNTPNTINGGTGDDTIHIGRAGDTVTGGAGKDVFAFDDIPWAPATIEDLHPDQGDSIDVSGILAKAGYTGSDPIADGYLKIDGDKIYADYHQPGNDGWWQVATVYTPAPALQYVGNGVIDAVAEQLGGTVTTGGSGVPTAGYDTIVMTGSNGTIGANDGGDTLIDQGSNNQLYGGRGNDTFVLGTSTTTANDGWDGVDTWVMNPQSTVLTHNTDGLWAGDRIDVTVLLAASHYTGSDPVADGYVFMANPPPPAPGEMGDFVASQLMYDPDGAAGPQAARALFDTYYTTPSQYHYADGFFVVH